MKAENAVRKGAPILPPTYLLIAILLMVGVHFAAPIIQVVPGSWKITGLIPLFLGLIMSIGGDSQFKKEKTAIKPFDEPSIMVTGGWFKISRNPMYLGFILVLVGVSFLLGSLASFLVIFLFAIVIQMRFIRFEEKMMAETFGKDWNQYVQKVRRWI